MNSYNRIAATPCSLYSLRNISINTLHKEEEEDYDDDDNNNNNNNNSVISVGIY